MIWKRRRTDEDFATEIRSHLELERERLQREGLSPDEARAAARRAFGSVTAARERFYESRRFLWLDHLRQDARLAARSLARYPVSCAVAVISLAGGIGATTATLMVRDVVFHKPPALYRAPGQLSRVQVGSPDRPIRPMGNPVHGRLYALWRDDAALGATPAAAAPARALEVRTADRTETVRVRAVTPEFFAVLGVDAALGRTFSASSPRIAGSAPAVLSYRNWQTLFDGRADAVGSALWIDNQPHLVVGVMPERFWFSSMDSPIWTPLDAGAALSETSLEVVFRRQAGLSPEQLEQRLQRGLADYASRLPSAERRLNLRVSGLEGTPVGRAVSLALPWLLGVAVLLTLVIACANVAILVIAQWTVREHEIAICASLGASRGRIVRALLTESVLIAAMGGTLGVCATLALLGLIVRNAGGDMIRLFDLSLDPWILIYAMAITVLAGLVSGLGPALLETRRLHGNPMRALRSSDRERQRWRHALVALEIGVTVALLVVTTTMLGAYRRQLTENLGFRTHGMITMRIENAGGVPIARTLDVLRQMPGVAAAAASTTVPYLAFGRRVQVSANATGSHTLKAELGSISPEFFATLDVPLRTGRTFAASEPGRTAIVNELMAARLFPGRDPIGQRLWIGETSYEIVGEVTQYTNIALQAREWDAKVFMPLDERPPVERMEFLIRATNDPAAVARALGREVKKASAGNLVSMAVPLDQIMTVAGQEMLVGTAPLAPLIATGLLLTGAGIYGVLAFAVARRSRELAVRVALGATGREVVRLVAAHGLRLVILGTMCGVGATFALSRVLRASGGAGSFLDPDWRAFAIPVAIILGLGVLATWLPARRALRINPAVLLRAD